VVATEFAILALPLFVMFLGVMEIGYDFFVQEALDNAIETAARSVQIGQTQGTAGETSAKIVAAVCPSLGRLLSCANLVVGVAPIPSSQNYYTVSPNLITYANAGSKTGSVCTGTGGRLMLLAAWYNGPTFLGMLVPGFAISNGNGGLMHQTYASAAFTDEWFSGGQTAGSGC
jgi:Flp pilus assembly protein TadG